jgi:hypothetical protein
MESSQLMTGTTRRVDPWGQLHERRQIGKLMGNRGKLDLTRPADRQLWDHQRWISCDPDYRPPGHPEGERIVFTLGYTRVFFFDEPTALAAGHRPCHFCRREAFRAFHRLWVQANLPGTAQATVRIQTIDKALHAERTDRRGRKPTWAARANNLPAGTLYEHERKAYVAAPGGARRWTWEGYGPLEDHPSLTVAVLTPPSIVTILRAGYPVQLGSMP